LVSKGKQTLFQYNFTNSLPNLSILVFWLWRAGGFLIFISILVFHWNTINRSYLLPLFNHNRNCLWQTIAVLMIDDYCHAVHKHLALGDHSYGTVCFRVATEFQKWNSLIIPWFFFRVYNKDTVVCVWLPTSTFSHTFTIKLL